MFLAILVWDYLNAFFVQTMASKHHNISGHVKAVTYNFQNTKPQTGWHKKSKLLIFGHKMHQISTLNRLSTGTLSIKYATEWWVKIPNIIKCFATLSSEVLMPVFHTSVFLTVTRFKFSSMCASERILKISQYLKQFWNLVAMGLACK